MRLLLPSITFAQEKSGVAEVERVIITGSNMPGLAKDSGKSVKMKDGKEKHPMPVSTSDYNPCGWRVWLNHTTLTLGMQNVFDQDPPFVAGAFENNYDESLATIKGRFWYVQLRKSF